MNAEAYKRRVHGAAEPADAMGTLRLVFGLVGLAVATILTVQSLQ